MLLKAYLKFLGELLRRLNNGEDVMELTYDYNIDIFTRNGCNCIKLHYEDLYDNSEYDIEFDILYNLDDYTGCKYDMVIEYEDIYGNITSGTYGTSEVTNMLKIKPELQEEFDQIMNRLYNLIHSRVNC